MVGMAGFEPTTTRPPDECATRLRYIPNNQNREYFTLTYKKMQGIFAPYPLPLSFPKGTPLKNLLLFQ